MLHTNRPSLACIHSMAVYVLGSHVSCCRCRLLSSSSLQHIILYGVFIVNDALAPMSIKLCYETLLLNSKLNKHSLSMLFTASGSDHDINLNYLHGQQHRANIEMATIIKIKTNYSCRVHTWHSIKQSTTTTRTAAAAANGKQL